MISHDGDANNVESCNCEKFAKCLNAGTAACIGRQVSSKLELGNLGRSPPIPSTGQWPVPSRYILPSTLTRCLYWRSAVLDIRIREQEYWTGQQGSNFVSSTKPPVATCCPDHSTKFAWKLKLLQQQYRTLILDISPPNPLLPHAVEIIQPNLLGN